MTSLLTYSGLFAVALGAASILPMQSEPVLVALLLLSEQPIWALVAVASLGNTLGSCVNWLLGRAVERFRDRRWFPVAPDKLARAEGWYARWGRWSLLMSWAPIIGDPLTIVAGFLREPLRFFIPVVTAAKAARYIAVAAIAAGFIG